MNKQTIVNEALERWASVRVQYYIAQGSVPTADQAFEYLDVPLPDDCDPDETRLAFVVAYDKALDEEKARYRREAEEHVKERNGDTR